MKSSHIKRYVTPHFLHEFFALNSDHIDSQEKNSKIIIIGVGGPGCNTINQLGPSLFKDVITITANTDIRHLRKVVSDKKIILGLELTQGNGAGNNPEIGRQAAHESLYHIRKISKGVQIAFITTGLGGGTGTGASVLIAQELRNAGVFTVGLCTLPFKIEGTIKRVNAQQGLDELRKHCDSLIVIPNDNLVSNYKASPIQDAFLETDKLIALIIDDLTNTIIEHHYDSTSIVEIDSHVDINGNPNVTWNNLCWEVSKTDQSNLFYLVDNNDATVG